VETIVSLILIAVGVALLRVAPGRERSLRGSLFHAPGWQAEDATRGRGAQRAAAAPHGDSGPTGRSNRAA
jgi:hypothetical protein